MTKIHFKTYGCSANFAESEIMKGILEEAKFEITEEINSEVIILNVCTVKGNNSMLKEIRNTKLKHPEKKLVITGCIPKQMVAEIKQIDVNASLIGTGNIKQIIKGIEKTLEENPIELLEIKREDKSALPRKRSNPLVGIIPVSSGCLDACGFCSTRLLKGRLFSYSEERILSEVSQAINEGCKELWITGQDTACYGFERGSNLARLLEKIVAIQGDFKVRIGMGNPRHIPKFLDELITILKHPKIFKFLHLPVQSGSEEVLKSMKRGHTAKMFREIISRLREEIPELTMSTDIIVGYPGETEEQFEETLKLLREVPMDAVNISRFQAREGTLAYNMENQIHGRISKERSRKVTKVYEEIAAKRNILWEDWKGEVMIDQKGKHNTWVGRNYAYKPVILEGEFKLGQIINIKVNNVTTYDLRAECL